MNRQSFERIGLMKAMTPELFNQPGTMLYVGAWVRRFAASDILFKSGNELTVLEIWEPFLEELKTSRFAGRAKHFVLGDVCQVDTLCLPHERYDYTLWLHGPEHISAKNFIPTVEKLEALTDKLVVITCPWGRFKHGVAFDNPHTRHLNHLYPFDFQRLGYRYACIGPVDVPGNQLMAWKRLDK